MLNKQDRRKQCKRKLAPHPVCLTHNAAPRSAPRPLRAHSTIVGLTTLQRGDRIGHGHFTKWRQAIEESCAKHGREAFWVRSMGGGKSKQKQWNQALRNDQSFPLGDEGKDTIQKVRFADVDRVECYESSDDYRKYSHPDRTEADTNGRRKRYLRLEIDRAHDYRRGGGGLATTVRPITRR